MNELKDLIERATADYRPGEPPLGPILRRARQRDRTRRLGVIGLIGVIVAFLVASAVGAFEPAPQSFGPVAPDERRASCGVERSWFECSKDWSSRFARAAGFDVAPANGGVGDATRAVEVTRDGTTLYLYADAHEELQDFGTHDGYLRELGYRETDIRLSDGSPVWTDDLNHVWDTQQMRVYIQPRGATEQVTRDMIVDLSRASESTPVE